VLAAGVHPGEHLAELGLDVLRPTAPSAAARMKSPASFRHDSRRSVKNEECATVSVSSSRVVGKHDPTAFTCAPLASQRFSTIGSVAAVVVQTTSAPKSAASTEGATIAPTSPASCSAASSFRDQILISGSPSTARIACTCPRACAPEPRMATRPAPGRANARVATADTAAVRISVIGDAFIIATSSPVSPSCRRTPPMCVSRPRAGFVGTTTISLSAYADAGSARYAGISPSSVPASGGRAIERSG